MHILTNNPVSSVDKSTLKFKDISDVECYTIDKMSKLHDFLLDKMTAGVYDTYDLAILLSVHCAIRVGEIKGLHITDYNPYRIHILQQSTNQQQIVIFADDTSQLGDLQKVEIKL